MAQTFLLLVVIANEKNMILIQLDTLASTMTPNPVLAGSNTAGVLNQGIYNNRYTQRELKLKLSALLKDYMI